MDPRRIDNHLILAHDLALVNPEESDRPRAAVLGCGTEPGSVDTDCVLNYAALAA